MLDYEGVQINSNGEDEYQYTCINKGERCTTRLFTESQLKKIMHDTGDVDPI